MINGEWPDGSALSKQNPRLTASGAKQTSTDQSYMGPPVLFAPNARQRSAI
jgi:hypothetical protein